MHWQVIIPPQQDGGAEAVVTVEAENWFAALREGLQKHGLKKQVITNLTCDIKSDRSVSVMDFVTKRVFTLRPLDEPDIEVPLELTVRAPAHVPTPLPKPVVAPVPTAKVIVDDQTKRDADDNARREAEQRSKAKKEAAELAHKAADARAKAQSRADAMVKIDDATKREADAKLKQAHQIVKHDLFFSRDEAPNDDSGIFYRERLLSVTPGITQETASLLARLYFEHLHLLAAPEGTKLFISVQIFDHRFTDRSIRPAIAALTWRQWTPKKPRILFPLSGADDLTFSKIPIPPIKDDTGTHPTTTDPGSVIIPLVHPKIRPEEPIPLERPKAAPSKANVAKSLKDSSPRVPMGDKIIDAFEKLEHIYTVRDHDSAAAFMLKVSRELIPCEAGSCMLLESGKLELYIAAAEGPVAAELKGRRVSLKKSVVGHATRTSTVVNVSDAASDPRFDADTDAKTGFLTRTILCAPIQHEGRTIGAIELLNSVHPQGFTPPEADVLSYLSGRIGEYLEHNLPSREAEFTAKDFAFPTAIKKPEPRPAAPTGKAAPASQKAAHKADVPPPTKGAPAATAATVGAKAKLASPAQGDTNRNKENDKRKKRS